VRPDALLSTLKIDKTEVRMKDYAPHLRSLVESHTPDDSRILMPHGGRDMIILVTWRLHDPLRPSKRSRMIRILITQESLEDYARGNDGHRLASDTRFTEWLQQQLKEFDPNHDTPLGTEPSPVTWNVSTIILNG
jgi:hypothetical protein